MKLKADRNTLGFFGIAITIYVVTQILISLGVLSDFWMTLLRFGAVLAMVSLGLNLIYGFNGQFSLGQYGFYAIGAYSAADVTYRWTQLHSASGLVVLLLGVAFTGLFFLVVGKLLKSLPRMDTLSAFGLYVIGTIMAGLLAVLLGKFLISPITNFLLFVPKAIAAQIVFLLAVLLAGVLTAEVAFLFGLPVLALGSDYFGIATLGFTIIVKVLLDNSDTMFGFQEMKGARGMVGIPQLASWFWVYFFLMIMILIARNLLHSSYGRAIISVREDEIAAKSMGIDVTHYKTLTFIMGSTFAGLAGGIYAHINGFLHPDIFNFIKSFDPLIIVVFGGLGSITGTIAAAFGIYMVLEGVLRLVLPQGFETWRYVVYPLLLLVMMLLRPKGLFGTFEVPFLRQILPPPLRKSPGSPENEHEVISPVLPTSEGG